MASSNFKKEYARLNPAQRLAVDTIEGPVMVIAGAGTGKTQTIALRIANILKTTQTPPGAILALTFTETATIAMRQRLLSIIGSSAYNVKISTFHSFCHEVIQTHPDYFPFARDLQNLDELDKIEIIQKILDKRPQSSPLKPWGAPYFYQKHLISHIQTLKRENITPEDLQKLITNQQDFLSHHQSPYQQFKKLKFNKELEPQVLSILKSLLKSPDIPPPLLSQLNFYQNSFDAGSLIGPAKSPTVNLKNTLIHFFDQLQKNIKKQFELQKIYALYQKHLQTLS